MHNLPDAAESRKESQNPDGPLVEMAHGLVPGLEGIPEIAGSESQPGLIDRQANRAVREKGWRAAHATLFLGIFCNSSARQECSRNRTCDIYDHFGRSLGNDLASGSPAFGTQVDDPV